MDVPLTLLVEKTCGNHKKDYAHASPALARLLPSVTGTRKQPLWLSLVLRRTRKLERNSSRIYVRVINQAWRVIASSYVLATGHFPKCPQAMMLGIYRFAKWLLQASCFSGIEYALKRVKFFFDYFRMKSGEPREESKKLKVPGGTPGFDRNGTIVSNHPFFIGDASVLSSNRWPRLWKIQASWAFSLGKKALGPPTKKQRMCSIRKFKTNVEECVQVTDKDKEEIPIFINEFLSSLGVPKGHTHVSFSGGATLQTSKSKGGLITDAVSSIPDTLEELKWVLYGEEKDPKGPFLPSGHTVQDLEFYPESQSFGEGEDKETYYSVSFAELLMFEKNRLPLLISLALIDLHNEEVLTVDGELHESDNSVFPLFEEMPSISVGEGHLETRLGVVDDKGFKGRVISIFDWAATVVGHVPRTMLSAILKGDKTGHIPALTYWGYKKLRKLEPPYYSIDLSSATDLSQKEIYSLFAESIHDYIVDQNFDYEWSRNIFEPACKIFYENLKVLQPNLETIPKEYVDEVEEMFPIFPKRESPMGSPPSWLLLCLDLMFRVWRTARDVGRPWNFKEFLGAFCGDDVAIGGVTPEFYQSLREEIVRCGHQPSDGTDIYSDSVLQFVERIYIKLEDGKPLEEMVYPKINCLLPCSVIERLPGRKKLDAVSSRGEAATETIGRIRTLSGPEWDRKISRASALLAHYSNAESVQRVKSLNICLYLPKTLGGYGFPSPDGKPLKHVGPFHMNVVRALLHDDRSIDHMIKLCSLAYIWQDNPKNELSAEARRLTDLWVESVLEPELKGDTPLDVAQSWMGIETKGEIENKYTFDDQHNWVEVGNSYAKTFGSEMNDFDWEQYDALKDAFAKEGVQLVPLQSAIDHVFRKNLLYLQWYHPTCTSSFEDEPSLRDVGKRATRAYKALIRSTGIPNKSETSYLANLSTAELVQRLKWRLDQILIVKKVEALNDYSGKW